MKFAAIQMSAEFANVAENLKKAEKLASKAFYEGAECVILPEFFPSAIGFHPQMLNVAQPLDGKPMKLLKNLATKHQGIIGGSFIAFKDGDNYNTFVLAFPDGSIYFHNKDQPTMWENCYYIGGNDDGVLTTKLGNVGIALCWEFIRTRTIKRMRNRIDIVLGGSCWWTLPEKKLRGFPPKLHDINVELMSETPSKFAKILGVPVIHAAHAGEFQGKLPLYSSFSYKSYYLGETQIVDGNGTIIKRMTREEGEGFIIADVDITKKSVPTEPIPNRFWIPNLPRQLRFAWWYQNLHGRRYYRKKIHPYYVKYFQKINVNKP